MSHAHGHDESQEPRPHGLLAEFAEPEQVVEAARRAYDQGFRKMDAYSPMPVEGLAEAIGFHRNRVPLIVLIGGLLGALTGFGLQWYTAVIDYPYDIGGRPYNSWPSFIPITFELTILGAATCATVGMLIMNGLPKPYNPVFNAPNFTSASNDGFFLCIEADDPKFDAEETRRFLEGLQPKSITLVDR